MKTDRRVPLAIGIDVFVVSAFVMIGRRNHDEGSAFADVLETGAPFLIGLGLAWILVRAWRHPTAQLTGIAIWPLTVLAGMIVRRLAFGDGTATSFVVVATIFLGVSLVGWRAGWRAIARRTQRPSGRPVTVR